MPKKDNGPESSGFLGLESCEDLYFREGRWIPNPYLSNKDNVDHSSEYTFVGDDNVIVEAQALISLILFFSDNLKRSFNNNLVYLALPARLSLSVNAARLFLFGVVVVFTSGIPLRREALSSHFTVQYSHVVNRSDSNPPGKILDLVELREAEDLVELMREGFVVSATVLRAFEEGDSLDISGAGHDGLPNLNKMFSPSVQRLKTVRPQPEPQGLREVKTSQSSSKVIRRVSLTSSASLSRSQKDSLLVADAFRTPIDGHTPHNQKNLMSMQKITEFTRFVSLRDKIQWRQDMDSLVNERSLEVEEIIIDLNKLKGEEGKIEEISAKEKQLLQLKGDLDREKRWQKFHHDNILNPDKAVLWDSRTPYDWSHGDLAVTFKVYNQDNLIEKDKDFVNHNTPSFLGKGLNKIKAKTITPDERDEFERIASNAFEYSFDVNPVRLKVAVPTEEDITLLQRDKACSDIRYKRDLFKSEPNAVSLSVWNNVRKKLKIG